MEIVNTGYSTGNILDILTPEQKIDLEKNDSWIKPIALQKYIKQRFPAMNHDFKVEESL